MAGLFHRLFAFFAAHRRIFFVSLLLLGAILTLFSSRIRVEEDIFSFFPKSREYRQINTFLKSTPVLDKIAVSVSFAGDDRDQAELVAAADELVAALERYRPQYVKHIRHRIDGETIAAVQRVFYDNLPIFLEDADYAAMEQSLTAESLDRVVANARKLLMTPGSMVLKSYIASDPLGLSFRAMRRLQGLQFGDGFTMMDGYIAAPDGKGILLFIDPAQGSNMTAHNAAFFKKLDADIERIATAHGGRIAVDYLGVPLVSAENARQIRIDVYVTVGIALLLIGLLVYVVVRDGRMIFIMLLPIAFGIGVALSVISVTRGSVSLIALGIGSALLGITVDYSIHVTTHFRSDRRSEDLFEDIVLPVIMCALTTVFAFLSLLLSGSAMLGDLGLFAAVSVGSAALFSLVIIPQFYRRADRAAAAARRQWAPLVRFLSHPLHASGTLFVVFGVITVASLFFARSVGFERDMIRLNYTSPKVERAIRKFSAFENVMNKSVLFVADAPDMRSALDTSSRVYASLAPLTGSGAIAKLLSVSAVIPPVQEQERRIARWDDFWRNRRVAFGTALRGAAVRHSFRAGAFDQFIERVNRPFTPVPDADIALLRDVIFSDIMDIRDGRVRVVTVAQVDRARLPEVFARYQQDPESFAGVLLADKQFLMDSFVENVRRQFGGLTWVSIAAVFGLLILYYGRIELATITFLPIGMSWIVTLGIMGALGVKFNVFNIIVASIIFGLGIDYSILMTRGALQRYKYRHDHMVSFRESVLISALTTIIGMGVLVFAKHPALQSIAAVSVIGILSVYCISGSVPAYLIERLTDRRTSRPLTIMTMLMTLYTYCIMVLGMIGILVFAAGIMPLPLRFRRKRWLIRRVLFVMSRIFTRYSLVIPFHAQIDFRTECSTAFDSPAVIIANHRSMADIPILLSLTPDAVMLTKRWVWNTPLMGWVARLAGHCSVDVGMDQSMDRIRNMVAEGCSVIVFPEGSRTADGELHRFRKGAFAIAEELNLDIVTVLLHGTESIIHRRSSVIHRGRATAIVRERIAPGDPRYSGETAERARRFRDHYEREYARLHDSLADGRYFRHQLMEQYLYKGPVLEWYFRIKLRLEHYYEQFIRLVPANATVVDIGCGYGFLCHMLRYTGRNRTITGIDYDEAKIRLAAGIRHEHGGNPTFIAADAAALELPAADVFILNDVLHYCNPEQQERLLAACARQLSPRGMLLIRDGNSDKAARHSRTRLTEFFSTRFGFNRTKQGRLFFTSRSALERMAAVHDMNLSVVTEYRHTSNELYLLRRNG